MHSRTNRTFSPGPGLDSSVGKKELKIFRFFLFCQMTEKYYKHLHVITDMGMP